MSSVLELMKKKRVVVCVGTGGVGKTTTAAALGVVAARGGLNVLVLTVDPAKRLVTSLGIDTDSNVPTEIHGENFSGKMSAGIIQEKAVFDDFVRKSAASEQEAERMMQNRLYRQLTTRLTGSQEFTSLEVLAQSVESENYDVIILDTPPAQHALDFLKAPMKLHSLFQNSVTHWFIGQSQKGGFFKKLVAGGADRVFSILQQLTGSGFIGELREFFELAQSWQQVLAARMVKVHEILSGPDSAFVLVTSFDEAKLEEAFDFQKKLKKEGYVLAGLIINKAFPLWIQEEGPAAEPENVSEKSIEELYQTMYNFFKRRQSKLDEYRSKIGVMTECFKIPELKDDVSDLLGIQKVADRIESEI